MTKQWFVLHTLTGQEQKVKRSIEARVRIEEMGEYIGDVVIPTEKVSEVKNGVKTTVTRKFFPGYVLINLVLYAEDGQKKDVLEPTWRFLKETSGVIGFVGGERPMPLAAAEVDAIINQVADKGQEKVKPKVQFEPGETVKITDGPFLSFNGTVDEVDPDRGKLKVSVAIFGRSAPVELEYWQVERAVENA
ncbi:MAG: transcription termination/antitermination protein NusG [Verrucomicrobiota bacterium]|jgi:transcriptional antiterminator NusG|nr:transcription termination/antitermination protein NusG [Verrucomicrobiota bacterium]